MLSGAVTSAHKHSAMFIGATEAHTLTGFPIQNLCECQQTSHIDPKPTVLRTTTHTHTQQPSICPAAFACFFEHRSDQAKQQPGVVKL